MCIAVNSRINEWLQIAAALGVIAGLVLVAYQIRETNRYWIEPAFGESGHSRTEREFDS